MSLERLGVGTYKTTCAADTEYFGEPNSHRALRTAMCSS